MDLAKKVLFIGLVSVAFTIVYRKLAVKFGLPTV
jgi:hypothetical protein